MTKAKKTGAVFLATMLLISLLWCYWEWPMSMASLLPEENWVRAELCWGSGISSYHVPEFENPELDKLLSQMDVVKLNRAEARNYLDDRYFQIILYKGKSYPTMIYVGDAGNVQIARELDFDHWKNYEGGEELYRYLSNLSQRLPAIYPMT